MFHPEEADVNIQEEPVNMESSTNGQNKKNQPDWDVDLRTQGREAASDEAAEVSWSWTRPGLAVHAQDVEFRLITKGNHCRDLSSLKETRTISQLSAYSTYKRKSGALKALGVGRGWDLGKLTSKAGLVLGDPIAGEEGMGCTFLKLMGLGHCVSCFRSIKLEKKGVRCCWSR